MGQLRFVCPRPEHLPEDVASRTYMAGIENIPWQSHAIRIDNQLIIDREVDESGCLFVPWNVKGHGQLTLSTASVMERENAYNLPVELARGTINRIRNQLAAWEPQGFTPSPELQHQLQMATVCFSRAATGQQDPEQAADQAEEALVHALDAIDRLNDDFSTQVLALRHQQMPKLPTLLVGSLGQSSLSAEQVKHFRSAFNSAVVSFNWHDIETNENEHDWSTADKQVEWCRATGMKVCGGPLLRLTKGHLPDWIYLWEDDFDEIRQYALQYVQAVVQRFRGMVHIWHCAAAMNTPGTLSLPEEYKLKITVDAIQTVAQVDPKAPIVVSFNQPWAEYLAEEDLDLSPLHFADALVRADLGVAGIGLEINLGYWPGGTLMREMLEMNRLIDFWSQLGLPLLVMLTVPSSTEPDAQARQDSVPVPDSFPGGISPQSQMEYIQRLVPLLLAKQSIHGVVWNQLCDSHPHDFAHGGLFDAAQEPKPALEVLAKLRQNHLT